MYYEEVFSWAENVEGKMVHIDTVPNGKHCGCICPNCHEKLVARHGDINAHGFAHLSHDREANLDICYKVTLLKLAEQIIETQKRIHVPSYYGIYKETDIEFVDVKIDFCFEREDRQPDVIATTKENQKYLIVFCFDGYVRHKQSFDYHGLTYLLVNLTRQKLNSLENFLLASSEDRYWINNDVYFKGIEKKYREIGKLVKLVQDEECKECKIRYSCCAVMLSDHGFSTPLVIKNNGQLFRLCKTEKYMQELKKYCKQQEEDRLCREANHRRWKEKLLARREPENLLKSTSCSEIYSINQDTSGCSDVKVIDLERTCFNCEMNLGWACKDGWAHCAICSGERFFGRVSPEQAKQCPSFTRKKP